jgi:quercetin dioxygenase-like cupin family protein
MLMTRYRLIVFAGIAATVAAPAASGHRTADALLPQPPGVTRTELQRHDLGVAGREAIQMRIALAPGVAFPDHRHPGEEIIYVLDGTFEYRVEGRLVMIGAGEVLFIPAGTIHSARNIGSRTAVELATYIVEKGRPLVVLGR